MENSKLQISIQEIVEKLDKLALFHLSLASRELFHSNFWYWLSTIGSDGPRKLYRALAVEDDTDHVPSVVFRREVRRKENKSATADLVAMSGDYTALLVVENKLKDIPRKEQLQRLSTAFESDSPLFVVVTPLPPEMLDDLRQDESLSQWSYLQYGKLAEKIRELFLPTGNSYHDALIHEYIHLLTHLSALSQALFRSSHQKSYDFVKDQDPNLFDALNRVKLWELYQRIRGSDMARYIGAKLKERGIDVNPVVGINHKKATIDFKLFLETENQVKSSAIGIQIEGNQYRKILEMPNNCDVEAKKLIEQGIWFIPRTEKSLDRQLCKYGSTFRYQYEKIQVGSGSSDSAELSFDSLANRIALDLQQAPFDILKT